MTVKLITELTHDIRVLREDKKGEDNYFIEGIFMQAETKNRNGRVYPRDILVKEASRYSDEFVKTSRAMGELGHPEGPTVNLDRVSHLITSLDISENNIIGKAKILNTPVGNIAKNLLKEGVKLGVSTRGMGSLREKNGVNIVQPDFMLSAVDIVADPSAPDAFVNGIMEGREWIWDHGRLREIQIDTYKKRVSRSSRSDLTEVKLQVWEDFLKSL